MGAANTEAANTDGTSKEGGSAVTLSPFYHSSVNEITQPDKYAAHSHYLTRRWKRELGPTGYAILTSLRDRCFYNRKTGELRNAIQITMSEIGDECGISEKTVRREIASNKALQRFVRAQREFEADKKRGGFRFGPNSFQVAMDDPLHPQDEAELIEIVRRKADASEKAGETPLERARRRAASGQTAEIPSATSGQSDRTQTACADNLAQRPVNLTRATVILSTPDGQNDRTLKSPDSSLPENTLPDAADAAPDYSLSLFEEKSQEWEGPAAPPAWSSLTEAERSPWLDRARQELVAIHAGTGITPKPKLVETRARNLYDLSGGANAGPKP